MQPRLVALKHLLDGVGVKVEVDTLKKRKLLQKTIYLIQAIGLDLGYHFGWYEMGPYGPSLAEDYHSLSAALATGDDEIKNYRIRDSVADQLEKLKPLLTSPQRVNLSQDDWLELLASIHFLAKVAGYTWEEILETLQNEKPYLKDFAPRAKIALESIGLL